MSHCSIFKSIVGNFVIKNSTQSNDQETGYLFEFDVPFMCKILSIQKIRLSGNQPLQMQAELIHIFCSLLGRIVSVSKARRAMSKQLPKHCYIIAVSSQNISEWKLK